MSKTLIPVVALSLLTVATQRASADNTTPEPKSRETAFALSAGGTALSVGLVVLGGTTHNGTMLGVGLLSSLITPSAGKFYADGSITGGLAIRAASAVVVVAGVGLAARCVIGSVFDDACHDTSSVEVLFVTGALGYTAGIVYDIATTGTAVDEYNRRFNLRVAPTVMRTTSSGTAVGVGIGGSF